MYGGHAMRDRSCRGQSDRACRSAFQTNRTTNRRPVITVKNGRLGNRHKVDNMCGREERHMASEKRLSAAFRAARENDPEGTALLFGGKRYSWCWMAARGRALADALDRWEKHTPNPQTPMP